MEIASFSEFSARAKEYLDRICDNHDTLIITRGEKKNVVVMSLAEYNSLNETLYLLSSKKNARRVIEAIDQLSVELIAR